MAFPNCFNLRCLFCAIHEFIPDFVVIVELQTLILDASNDNGVRRWTRFWALPLFL